MTASIKEFTAVDLGDGVDGTWARLARNRWPGVRELLRPEGLTEQGRAAALETFAAHMPELLPVLHRLAAQLDDPHVATALSHTAYRSPFTGCSQAGIAGSLVRNYDFHPDECDGVITASRFLRPVIGMGDLLWGLLDGMNDAGLAISLTFGGRTVHGPGFDVLLVVRYLLETCTDAHQAWQALRRLPASNAQNLTLVDPTTTLTVHIAPDRAPVLAAGACTTNHQDDEVPAAQEHATKTRQRLTALQAAVEAATRAQATRDQATRDQTTGDQATGDPVDAVADALLHRPLYQTAYEHRLGTLYTAVYRPGAGRVSYRWPQDRWDLGFDDFSPGRRTVTLGEPLEP